MSVADWKNFSLFACALVLFHERGRSLVQRGHGRLMTSAIFSKGWFSSGLIAAAL